MKVQVKYKNGRLDVFDTDSYTASQPFGEGCMLANYEVRFDQLDKGLWLQAHFYETDSRFKDEADEGTVPVGRRSMGWRFLLAEVSELNDVEQVAVDGDRALIRMGDALVDVTRLDIASALLLSDGGGPSLASQLQGVVEALRRADEGLDDEAAAKQAGGDWGALTWARELHPLQQVGIEDEEEGWMDVESD